jgi:hypothetical protein
MKRRPCSSSNWRVFCAHAHRRRRRRRWPCAIVVKVVIFAKGAAAKDELYKFRWREGGREGGQQQQTDSSFLSFFLPQSQFSTAKAVNVYTLVKMTIAGARNVVKFWVCKTQLLNWQGLEARKKIRLRGNFLLCLLAFFTALNFARYLDSIRVNSH